MKGRQEKLLVQDEDVLSFPWFRAAVVLLWSCFVLCYVDLVLTFVLFCSGLPGHLLNKLKKRLHTPLPPQVRKQCQSHGRVAVNGNPQIVE